MVLHYKGHSEQVQLAVTRLGKQKLILRYSWLWKHNLEINWDTQDVKMNWCPSGCMTCTDEMRTKCKHTRTAAQLVQQLQSGPVLAICVIDAEDRLGKDDNNEFEEDLLELLLDDLDDSDNKDDLIKDRDRIFYTRFSPPKDICATSTVSQCLAEAFAKNSAPGKDELPEWVHDFKDVFNWEAFNSLPDRQLWDHTIKHVPDSKLANCKVYPISPSSNTSLMHSLKRGYRPVGSGHQNR